MKVPRTKVWTPTRDVAKGYKFKEGMDSDGLPFLLGSARQLPWAKRIRADHHKQLNAWIAGLTDKGAKKKAKAYRDLYLSEIDAHAWIERRAGKLVFP